MSKPASYPPKSQCDTCLGVLFIPIDLFFRTGDDELDTGLLACVVQRKDVAVLGEKREKGIFVCCFPGYTAGRRDR